MEEDNNQEDKSSHVSYHRSPIFRKNEVKALVDQIAMHKNIILNKCTNTSTNQAKEEAWEVICKEINKQGFEHKRTVDSLKIKWLNLKRDAKKLTKNIIDVNCSDINDVLAQVVMLINENDVNTNVGDVPQEDKNILKLEAVNDVCEENDNNMSNFWDSNTRSQSDDSNNDDDHKRGSRSLNFTPAECSLLLRCVKDEKNNILYKGRGNAGKAIKIASSAWSRITHKYNKLSPQKRSTKVLRTKFSNMKKLALKVDFKNYIGSNTNHERLEEESLENIKHEPTMENIRNMDMDKDSDDDDDDYMEMHLHTDKQNEDNLDPLSTVLNGDSGMESISHAGSYTPFDNKEVVKLKLELLNYQLETAKLERERIKQTLDAEISERQARAIETSLRLRAARLDAVASESKLPAGHAALVYGGREKLAQEYLQQFGDTYRTNNSESDNE